jgi:hypothetical protein
MRCAKMQNIAPCLLIDSLRLRKMAPCAEWPVAPVSLIQEIYEKPSMQIS